MNSAVVPEVVDRRVRQDGKFPAFSTWPRRRGHGTKQLFTDRVEVDSTVAGFETERDEIHETLALFCC